MTTEKKSEIALVEMTGRETLAALTATLNGLRTGKVQVAEASQVANLCRTAAKVQAERRKIMEQARQPVPADMVEWAEK